MVYEIRSEVQNEKINEFFVLNLIQMDPKFFYHLLHNICMMNMESEYIICKKFECIADKRN